MQEYITTVSRYLLPLCMGFYAFECFSILLSKKENDRSFLYIRQNFWMFSVQFISFVNLALVSRNKQYIYMYILIQLFLFALVLLPVLIYKKINRLLLNNMAMLMGIGLVMLCRLSLAKAQRQFIIMVGAVAISMFVPILIEKMKALPRLTWLYATVGILLLSVVLLLSESTFGAKISYTIKGLTFQPSEFVKILFIFFIAGALHENHSFKRVCITTVIAALHVLVLVCSTDLGGALIFFVAYLAMLFVATNNVLYLLAGAVAGSGAAVVAYHVFDHIKVRVLAWQDPWSYIDGKGYQITQSLFAIGSGSWFGMGLHSGNPDDIPLVEADFIFSSICEEYGAIFAVCFILMIVSCFLMMMEIALAQKSNFYRLVALGIGVVYIFQIFLTVGGGIKFIPLTGVTLPFISYGGSSVLSTMLMFFVLQGISIINAKEGGKRKRVVKKKRKVSTEIIEVELGKNHASPKEVKR